MKTWNWWTPSSTLEAPQVTFGDVDHEINCHIQKASAASNQLGKIWKNQKLTLPLKMQFYRTNVLTTFLYGSETWQLTMGKEKKLNICDMKFLCQIIVSSGLTPCPMPKLGSTSTSPQSHHWYVTNASVGLDLLQDCLWADWPIRFWSEALLGWGAEADPELPGIKLWNVTSWQWTEAGIVHSGWMQITWSRMLWSPHASKGTRVP